MRHSRTETITIGTSSAATIPTTAPKRAPCGVSSAIARSIRYPPYSSHRMKVVVRRESQVHHVPQIGLAQIEPVTSTSVQKTIPVSAAA